MQECLAGKVVLLTGSPTPLSLTVARRLGNEGAALAFVGTRVSRDTGVQALLYQFRRESVCVDTDISDPQAMEAAMMAVEEELGPVELVIHTLGAPEPLSLPQTGDLVIKNSTAPLVAALTCTR